MLRKAGLRKNDKGVDIDIQSLSYEKRENYWK
jgi:hypothetical protein